LCTQTCIPKYVTQTAKRSHLENSVDVAHKKLKKLNFKEGSNMPVTRYFN